MRRDYSVISEFKLPSSLLTAILTMRLGWTRESIVLKTLENSYPSPGIQVFYSGETIDQPDFRTLEFSCFKVYEKVK